MEKIVHMICTSVMLYCTPEDTAVDQKLENLIGRNEEVMGQIEADAHWKIAWQEDFDGTELNPDSWNVLDDAFGHGNRKQHYTPRNVGVSDGLLKITTKEEWSEEMPYTSGAVTTKGKVIFQQGKIEVRAKMPSGTGLLPAIWLWTNNGKEFPEIDIVEILGQEPDKAWSTLHYDNRGIYAKTYGFAEKPDLTRDFHTYGVEWHPDRITFLIDGAPVYTAAAHFPNEEMYLFINTGVGGDWVGEPDGATGFPKELLVDWIKYYKK